MSEKKEIAKFGDHKVYRIIEKIECIFIISYISESEIDKYQQENETWYLLPPSMYHTDDCDKVYEIPLMIIK